MRILVAALVVGMLVAAVVAQDSTPATAIPEAELLRHYSEAVSRAIRGTDVHLSPEPYSYALVEAQANLIELQRRASDRQERIVRWSLWVAVASSLLAAFSVLLASWTVRRMNGYETAQAVRHEKELAVLRALVRAARRPRIRR
jgi:hypothetical protein